MHSSGSIARKLGPSWKASTVQTSTQSVYLHLMQLSMTTKVMERSSWFVKRSVSPHGSFCEKCGQEWPLLNLCVERGLHVAALVPGHGDLDDRTGKPDGAPYETRTRDRKSTRLNSSH